MSLLAVERTKLLSTRSPWWSVALATVVSLGFAVLFAALSGAELQSSDGSTEQFTVSPAVAASGVSGISLYIIMIMAALAVTTEYRFGIIRTTFLAAPNRTTVILTKAGFLALVSLVIGEVLAFLSYGVAKLIKSDLAALDSVEYWRQIAGVGLVYAIAAVIAVAVGTLLRQSAAALALLLLWPLVVENLVTVIPRVGPAVAPWLPFGNAQSFLNSGNVNDTLGTWGSLAYFAAVAAVLLAAAVAVVERRDA